jgi:hypothetical protein
LLRDRFCDITIQNKHVPSQGKSGDTKDRFYEELEQVFNHCPKYNMKFLLGEFNAKLGKEDIFKPAIGNDSLHEDSNDNGFRVLNFVT